MQATHSAGTWKKVLALLLVLTMCLSLVPGYAFAEDDFGIELAEDEAPAPDTAGDDGIEAADDAPAIEAIPDEEPATPDEADVLDVPQTPDEADTPRRSSRGRRPRRP